MTKAEIRKVMKDQRNTILENERKAYDAAILQHLISTHEYRHCQRFFCYISFGSELNTEKIILRALQEDKEVYVPRVEADRSMEFYRLGDFNNLQPSSFGVLEPLQDEKKRYQEQPFQDTLPTNLMLLPGLAFDIKGNRIGYGAGYYDRYLTRFPAKHFYKIAACYDFQLMEQIESYEYDIRADAIITPTRLIQCN